jgi:hypothetical protein
LTAGRQAVSGHGHLSTVERCDLLLEGDRGDQRRILEKQAECFTFPYIIKGKVKHFCRKRLFSAVSLSLALRYDFGKTVILGVARVAW